MPEPDRLIADLEGTRALVTGGAGFIGSHLVDGLLAAGARRVAVVDDLSLGREANLAGALGHDGVSLHVADAGDLSALQAVCDAAGPFDICFNLAVLPLPHSLAAPAANVDRNVAMTTAVCELGRAGHYRRLVQFSSSEVYGTAVHVPMGEEHPLHAHTPYAAAKAATDLIALSYGTTFGLDAVVVRPFNTYGERQSDGPYAGLVPAVIRGVRAGRPVVVNGDGEQTRDMTHVSDTVRGTLAIAATATLTGRAFNLGHGTEVTVNTMVAALLSALGRPGHPVVHGPERPGDVGRLVADVTAAREAVGYRPLVDVGAGFERTVRWYVQAAAALT